MPLSSVPGRYTTNLKDLIHAGGSTEAEIARELQIPYRSLSAYCNGRRLLPKGRREEIAHFLGLSPHTIFCRKIAEKVQPGSDEQANTALHPLPFEQGLRRVETTSTEVPACEEGSYVPTTGAYATDDTHLLHAMAHESSQEIVEAARGSGGQTMDLTRRQLLAAGAAAVLASPLWERLLNVVEKPSTIDQGTIKELEVKAQDCWQLQPDVLGIVSLALIDSVSEHLRMVILLLEGSLYPSDRARLSSVAAEFSQVLGQMFHHVGDFARADHYFRASMKVAKAAGNAALQAVGFGHFAFSPVYSGQPEKTLKAVPLFQEGLRLVSAPETQATLIRSWLAAREAEVYANLGDEYKCLKALEQAADLPAGVDATKGRGNEEYDPYYTCYDSALMRGYQGTSYLRLGRPKDAEDALKEATRLFHPARLYQQPFILVDLATAFSQQNRLDEACTVAEQALLITRQTRSPLHVQLIQRFRVHIERWKEEECVEALDAHISAVQERIARKKETETGP